MVFYEGLNEAIECFQVIANCVPVFEFNWF